MSVIPVNVAPRVVVVTFWTPGVQEDVPVVIVTAVFIVELVVTDDVDVDVDVDALTNVSHVDMFTQLNLIKLVICVKLNFLP